MLEKGFFRFIAETTETGDMDLYTLRQDMHRRVFGPKNDLASDYVYKFAQFHSVKHH